MLTNSSGTNHVINEYEDFILYDRYQIPFEIMPLYSDSASLVNQDKIPIELSY